MSLKRVKEIVLMHKHGTCPHCGKSGRSPHKQCYGCKRYVYDGEYWGMLERELGL
jgi:hypothetical protein